MKTIVNPSYPQSELTGKIIGCAFEVHNIIGPGFQEKIYQRSMAIEMSRQGLSFAMEFEHTIFYKGEIVGTRRSDFLVESTINIELKALVEIDDAHFAQALNYLEIYNCQIGLLINFGTKRLEYKRIINAKYRP
jgi:GxxExxY protein